MNEADPFAKLYEDIRLGRIKSDPGEEREFGLRGKKAREKIYEWVEKFGSETQGLESLNSKYFIKGHCLLGKPGDARFMHVEVYTFQGVFVSIRALYGKSYGKYPQACFDIDEDVPDTPEKGYFLLCSEQLGVLEEVELAIMLRNNPALPDFEERLTTLEANLRSYFADAVGACFERLSEMEVPAYTAHALKKQVG